ncbi:MAG: Gfo/Idh/MocA family protein [Vicinamibacteraceae bacterium]
MRGVPIASRRAALDLITAMICLATFDLGGFMVSDLAFRDGGTRLRGAVVGCGAISAFHLAGWRRVPEFDIVALVELDSARAAARRREFAPAAALHTTLEEAAAVEGLDFVDILTPPALHRAHCLAAARAGLHVICQKPLCASLEEATALVADLEAYPKLFAVHENHRYRPWFLEILRAHRTGFFGTLRYVRLEQHDPQEPPERFKAEAERGVLLEYGVHLADMLRALLGEPDAIHARLHRVNPRVRAESLAHVVWEYAHASAVVDISWKAGGVQQGSALVMGDEGEAWFEGRMTRGETARFRMVRGRTVVRDERRCPTDDYADAFYLLQRALTDSMLSGAPAPQAARDNLRTLALTCAGYDAAAAGGWVVNP